MREFTIVSFFTVLDTGLAELAWRKMKNSNCAFNKVGRPEGAFLFLRFGFWFVIFGGAELTLRLLG